MSRRRRNGSGQDGRWQVQRSRQSVCKSSGQDSQSASPADKTVGVQVRWSRRTSFKFKIGRQNRHATLRSKRTAVRLVCRLQGNIPAKHKTLRIHLNRAHSMELLPGCPDCFYFRSRWADVKKHCLRQHSRDIDRHEDDQGVAWGLTRFDDSKSKPTYSGLEERNVCNYPLKGEALSRGQITVVGSAQFLEPPTQSRSSSRESRRAKTTAQGAKRRASWSPTEKTSHHTSTKLVEKGPQQKSSKAPLRSLRPCSSTGGGSSGENAVGGRKVNREGGDKQDQGCHKDSRPDDARTDSRGTDTRETDFREQRRSPRIQSFKIRLTGLQSPEAHSSQRSTKHSSQSPVVHSSTPVSSTEPQGRRPRSSTPCDLSFLDRSQHSMPSTPGKSFLDESSSSRTTRQSLRRSLEQVVHELSTTAGTLETVSELSSPAPLRIPVLDPESTLELSRGTTTTSRDSSSGSSSTSSQSIVELLDPAQLPVGTEIRVAPTTVGTQTTLHLERDDIVLVVPRGGGRLNLQ